MINIEFHFLYKRRYVRYEERLSGAAARTGGQNEKEKK